MKIFITDEQKAELEYLHPTQGTKLVCKGQKTAVKTTGSRPRLNLMGALNLADISKTGGREYDRIDS